MKIYLKVKEGPRRECKQPYENARHVLAAGRCPKCDDYLCDPAAGIAFVEHFKVAGGTPNASSDDRAWECTAVCLACNAVVGTLRVEPGTLFGVSEDERVLNGKWRVY